MPTINICEPLITGGAPIGTVVTDAYSHILTNERGMDTATFTLTETQADIEDWLANGLNRHIVVYDASLTVIWEGFVDQVTVNLGAAQLVRGPLMNTANHVDLVYSTIDTTTTPPTPGFRATTGAVGDTASQAQYGRLPIVLSAGGVLVTEAPQIRDLYLNEHAWPETVTQLGLGTAGNAPTVQIACKGYAYRLAYPYNFSTVGASLVLNPGFENMTGPLFDNWTNSAGSGTYTNGAPDVQAGTKSLLLTAGGVDDTYTDQVFALTVGVVYEFYFWTHGDGAHAGAYQVIQSTGLGNTDLIPKTSTGIAGLVWTQVTNSFVPTTGMISVTVRLWAPPAIGNAAYFDTVYLAKQVQIDLSDKIKAIALSHPNTAWLNFDVTGVAPNATQVVAWENDDMLGDALIKAMVAEGDAALNRYVCGVWAQRQLVYAAIPTTVAYHWRLSSNQLQVTTPSGVTVMPWAVMPGQWVFIPDLLVWQLPATQLRLDPRYLFIESVTYTAPYGLQLNGSRVGALAQKLARLGLGGISG
jgi:hypothetical protein